LFNGKNKHFFPSLLLLTLLYTFFLPPLYSAVKDLKVHRRVDGNLSSKTGFEKGVQKLFLIFFKNPFPKIGFKKEAKNSKDHPFKKIRGFFFLVLQKLPHLLNALFAR
jgi:hypothetical protein